MRMFFTVFSMVVLGVSGLAADEYRPTINDVKVNGEVVSAETIGRIYDAWVKVYKAPADASGKKLTNELLDKLAQVSRAQAVRETAVKQYIAKNNLSLTPEQSKEDIEQLRDRMKDEKDEKTARGEKDPIDLDEMLAKSGKTEEQFAKDMTNRFLVQRALAAEMEKNMDKLKSDFAEEKKKLPLRKASQILFSYDKARFTSNNRTKEDAKKQADFALERLKKGEDFAAVAKELSDDRRTKEKGGDLGWVPPTHIPPAGPMQPVLDAIYALPKVDALSEVVESEVGYHILKLTEMKSEEAAFKKFMRWQVYVKTLSFETKLGEDAKVEEVKK